MVLVTGEDILAGRWAALTRVVRCSFEDAPLHSKGFSLRVLGCPLTSGILDSGGFDFGTVSDSVAYGGFPEVAYLGFGLGEYTQTELPKPALDAFVAGLKRLQARRGNRLEDFISDDIGVLGVADGVSHLLASPTVDDLATSARDWLLDLLDKPLPRQMWSYRMRALASDLLDERGRVRAKIEEGDPDRLALELCLEATWPHAFRGSPRPSQEAQSALLRTILVEQAPSCGDLERAVLRLRALDLLVDRTVEALRPSISDTVRILEDTQHSFKRWVWDKTARRGQVEPAHWLIDNEYHVQSFLWATLYPIYGSALVDETYLPGYGQVQPRFDLGVTNLKVIIEVKILRTRSDFAKVEEEISGDLGLYFKEPDRFDRMLVYIYDDCDEHYSERYDELRNALIKRDGIEHVVIVRRPSMIPPRNQRKST
ncbi:MAG: hypothetical protein ACOC6F_03080 [bacterium]